ncbi:MAG: hypothetical protein ICV68_08830 [Pyrinomonadaceae bacterium]|nr:hypothetical protein [Pyrinomonadaceae bacterium]
MGELTERQWAVISERGCEATGIRYAEARELMRRLAEQKVYGTAIVTAAAARRMTPALNQPTSSDTIRVKA